MLGAPDQVEIDQKLEKNMLVFQIQYLQQILGLFKLPGPPGAILGTFGHPLGC
jgi:hypothetical protein